MNTIVKMFVVAASVAAMNAFAECPKTGACEKKACACEKSCACPKKDACACPKKDACACPQKAAAPRPLSEQYEACLRRQAAQGVLDEAKLKDELERFRKLEPAQQEDAVRSAKELLAQLQSVKTEKPAKADANGDNPLKLTDGLKN